MRKNFDYVVTLRKNTIRPVNLICHVLMFLSVAAFIYAILREWQIGVKDYALILITLATAVWWALVLSGKKRKPYFRIGFFFIAIGWFLYPLHEILIGIFYIVAGLLEKQVKFPAEIGIDEEGLLFNTLPQKQVPWKAVRNVVIKDNLLTIDFKNNKLLQKELLEDISYDLEKEFNHYCREQLGKAAG